MPEFSQVLDRLRQVTTKYETLLTRMNPAGLQSTLLSIHGQKVRELLQNDKYAKKIKLVDDFTIGRSGPGVVQQSSSKQQATSEVEDIANKERQK